MSDLSDSENDTLSGTLGLSGSSSSSTSTSTSSSQGVAIHEQTPDQLSGLSDVPSPGNREGAARLQEILQVGSGTRPDRRFIDELGEAVRAPPVAAVDPSAEVGEAAERTASEASTSGRDASQGSDSTAPPGEPIHARQKKGTRPMRINDRRVWRRSDEDMVALAAGRPVYTVDFYTSAVTPRYLDALRDEFQIPAEVDLRVPGENDLPSRPPAGYITLSAEYLRAGLRLPFHPYLRRALVRLNVAPAQLNANAYRILVGCFILWLKYFHTELPFRAFQNLYRMKSAPSSTGFYYFQGIKGTFITGCPDSDKQFKHLWFYAGGRWLHGELDYDDVPSSERVPNKFRRGYVWTRAPHAPELTLDRVDALRGLTDPERSQAKLLSPASLAEHNWDGSSSSRQGSQPRAGPSGAVTIARMPPLAVHYSSRTRVPVEDKTSSEGSRVPPAHDLQSGGTSPEDWGPRVADEDMDVVLRGLYPARGIRIEGRHVNRVLTRSG